jgi:metallo-beta-lactamase family protein
MRVEFHGAARTVTGSATLLEAGGTRVLVDCGQFQGDDELEERNRGRLGFHPDALQALVLTHAHIDHVGRAPLLMRHGFRGRVLCTRATAALAAMMWRDGVKIAEEDSRRGGPPPAYGEKDVRALESQIEPLRYGEERRVGPGAAVRLSDAGHILGSAHVAVRLLEDGREGVFGVSGDVGAPGRPVVADPTPFADADWVQIESTYGDRDHKGHEQSLAELLGVLESAVRDQGVVLVPAFALGRTQDLLWHLNRWKGEGRLKDLAVYVDSPLAIRLTQVFRHSPGAMDDDAKALFRAGDDPFEFPGLRFVADARESESLTHEARGALIIASSGMCQGGRIVGHLAALLPRPATQVVFVGYQAPGTLGRRLVDRARTVRIRGRELPVNARIHTIGGFSAHAGRHDLIQWLRAAGERPQRVFLCHGEPPALDALAAAIRRELGLETTIPALGDGFRL